MAEQRCVVAPGASKPEDGVAEVSVRPDLVNCLGQLLLDHVQSLVLVREHQHGASLEDAVEGNSSYGVRFPCPGRPLYGHKMNVGILESGQGLALLLVERDRRFSD